MSVIQEHVVNNSVRYCSNMLQNTKICGSYMWFAWDGFRFFLVNHSSKTEHLSSQFFFSTIKKIVLLRFIKFKYHLVLSILQISKCLSTYRWGIANCNTAQNWSSHSQSKGDIADKHDHNNHSSDALQVGAVIHCSKECQFRDNTFNSDQRGGSLSFTEMK